MICYPLGHFSRNIKSQFSILPCLAFLPVLVLLAGCASNIPLEIRTKIPGSPSLEQVRIDFEKYSGARVRWGGLITKVENLESKTIIEILSRPLYRYGRPEQSDQSQGRFLARVSGFFDPAIYENGRLITIVGELIEMHSGKIGEYEYLFPVIAARSHYLWPPEDPLDKDYPHFWYYDPWCPTPYYPWGCRPY